jgi:uncharacterized protein YuzE
MVKTDTLEGIIDDSLHFHYDMFADVLYLRLLSAQGITTYGDINDDGDIVLRDETTDRAVGLTIVSWWKRFGHGALPDSIAEIQKQIEPLAKKVAA